MQIAEWIKTKTGLMNDNEDVTC